MKAGVLANGFDEALDGWVRAAFVRGVRTFPELVQSLPGVYPADALRAIGRLRQELPADWQLSIAPSVAPAFDDWPVEHPLDFDWRFTPEAARLLIDRCRVNAASSVAFLGAPSLAREAAAREWPTAIALFDQNPAIVETIRASLPRVASTCLDLLSGEPVASGDAGVAVADPPWYPEHMVAFLWAAARLTRLGGRVLLSLPPAGTRPGILAERDALFAEAASFGLRLASLEPAVLGYRTPLFERNALAAEGVVTVPWDWRRGDLAEFVVTAKMGVFRPTPSETAFEWDQEAIGVVRFKCKRHSVRNFRDPTLLSAVSGDILPSVSRRDARRTAADVWTCGNRVFKCMGPSQFRTIVSALGRGVDVHGEVVGMLGRVLSAEEREMVQRAMDQALALARIETIEIEHGYTHHVGGLDHEHRW